MVLKWSVIKEIKAFQETKSCKDILLNVIKVLILELLQNRSSTIIYRICSLIKFHIYCRY